MKAIVLSYDKHAGLCELVYKTYMDKWVDCPLEFKIPWNEIPPSYFKNKPNVELIKCGSKIHPTLTALLEGISDDEWVYWCIDDRYPLEVIDPQALTKIHDWLSNNPFACSNYDAIRPLRWKEDISEHRKVEKVIIAEQKFFGTDAGLWGFWHHQFIKAKFLKKVINSGGQHPWSDLMQLQNLPRFKQLLKTMRVIIPAEKSLVHFAETVSQGTLLFQPLLDLKKYKCEIPALRPLNRSKIFTHGGGCPWFEKDNTQGQFDPTHTRQENYRKNKIWEEKNKNK